MNRAGTIPPDIEAALWRYIKHGTPPRYEFLTAVLCNDLIAACGHANEEQEQMLPDIVRFLVAEAPAVSFGSEERMVTWMNCASGRRPV